MEIIRERDQKKTRGRKSMVKIGAGKTIAKSRAKMPERSGSLP